MAEHLVQCRYCKERFDAKIEEKDQVWIMPSTNFYYHKKCYDTWKSKQVRLVDGDWIPMIYDLLAREMKVSYNFHQIENQRKKCVADGMTNKGIYYTLYWRHIINQQRWHEEFGIGLVPHIYDQATNYWIRREKQTRGIVRQIQDLAQGGLVAEIEKPQRGKRRQHKAQLPE